MNLYFKPYTCCRWAHPAIDACLDLMDKNGITYEDIEEVTIETFVNATRLSKIVPHTADEAQYNIAYPVAASLIYGDFGIAQVHETKVPDPKVVEMMKKLYFKEDAGLTAQFPDHRICRAVIKAKDGRVLVSKECEPRGEAYENIGTDWLIDKFMRITGPVLNEEGQKKIIEMITNDEDFPIIDLVNEVNKKEYWKTF